MPISQADDLSAIRLLELADLGPPFDDDPCGDRAARDDGSRRHDASGPGTAALAPDRTPRSATGHDADGDWARQFAMLLAEALAGARPVRQLQPWLSERGRVHLHRLLPLFAGGHRPGSRGY